MKYNNTLILSLKQKKGGQVGAVVLYYSRLQVGICNRWF